MSTVKRYILTSVTAAVCLVPLMSLADVGIRNDSIRDIFDISRQSVIEYKWKGRRQSDNVEDRRCNNGPCDCKEGGCIRGACRDRQC